MKKSIFKFIVPALLVVLTISYSCKKYLDKAPVGSLNSLVLANKAGVDGLLIGAYSLLDMNSGNVGGSTWGASVSNWHFGGIASDDADKGSNATDQPPAAEIMNHSVGASNEYVGEKWNTLYAGIQRANDVIREIPLVKDGSVTSDYAAEVIAEARFLRGVYHLEAAKVFRNVPYVDESVTYSAGNFNVANPGTIWTQIENDFKAAFAVLPVSQPQVGRANKYAAEGFLAKTYMFAHDYASAKTALADLMANGKTTSGAKYQLLANYSDNFNASIKNASEAVFAVQMSVQDASNGNNGNPGDILNFPAAGPATCCGFYQPSFSLVDSYKTTAGGLPLSYDQTVYDATFLKSDQAVGANDATYMPDSSTPLDPRLDWTAGRRGIPFLDWGPMPGASWARAQADAGPYINVKNIYRKSAAGSTSDTFGGWAAGQSDAINFNMIRYSDVILWAAECEVEIGSLAQAEVFVNMVRNRAANPGGFVMGRLTGYTGGDATKPIIDNTMPAANYVIKPYAGQIASGTKENARQAVWFERKLEFAMEGDRFFDLQRYDGRFGGPEADGYMAGILNTYIQRMTSVPPIDPKTHLSTWFPNSVLNNNGTIATFTKDRNEIYPIPQRQIDLEHGALKQNTGGY